MVTGDETAFQPARYGAVAIALHWLIAVAIIANLAMGLWMSSAIDQPAKMAAAFRIFQIHKSLGLTVLVLSLARLAWRLSHKRPPYPVQMPHWQRLAAEGVHGLLYFLMIALPLTGWLYASTDWSVRTDTPFPVPTIWFGLFEVPHLPAIGSASEGVRRMVAGGAIKSHTLLAFGAIALIALHIAAALKHQFVDRDGTLGRMLPFLR